MDPNEVLRNIRDMVRSEDPDPELLASAIDSLDTWLTRGGFLPADWSR